MLAELVLCWHNEGSTRSAVVLVMTGFRADTVCIDIGLHKHSGYYNAPPVAVFPSTVSNISSSTFVLILSPPFWGGGVRYVDAVYDLRARLHGIGQVSTDMWSERTELKIHQLLPYIRSR
jgi:hypothetical protein